MLRTQNEKKEDVQIFVTCAESHATKDFPSLLGLNEVYQGDSGANKTPKKLYYVAPSRPWNASQPSTFQDPNSKFQGYAQESQSNWNTPFPLQPWPSQLENQSWKQGWQVTYMINP